MLLVRSLELTVLGSLVNLGQEERPGREWISLLEVTARELNPRSRAASVCSGIFRARFRVCFLVRELAAAACDAG